MRSFLLLLKVQMLGLFGINKALHADAARAKRTLAVAAVAAVGVVALVAAYVASVAGSFAQVGLVDAIPLVAVLVASVAGAVAAFLKANGVLFAFKDYDLVMSLPVRTSAVVLSRIAPLYAMGAALGLLVVVPAFAVYAANAGAGLAAAVCAVLSALLAPLAPLAVAVVLAALVAAASARFKHAGVVAVVLTFALVIVLMAGYAHVIGQGGGSEQLVQLGAGQMAALSSAYPPAAWAAAGITQGDLVSFGTFAAVNVLAAVVLAAVLVRLFVPVNSWLAAGRARGTFSFDAAHGGASRAGASARSPWRAMFGKEARLLLATPIYLLNACMGNVLLVVGTAALAAASVAGALPLGDLPPEAVPLIGRLAPWALAFCVGVASTTTASVSLEGSARWIMLAAPVPARTVLAAKAALNLALALPSVAVGGVLVALALPLDPLALVAVFAAPLACALFSTYVGLALDALRPRYDWTTPYEPVKRGMPVFAVALGGVVIVMAGGAAAMLVGAPGSLALSAAVAIVSMLVYRRVARMGLAA